MSRVKAIPLYLSGSEALKLSVILNDFMHNIGDPKKIDHFTFILGQNPFCDDTYLKITYDGLDDIAIHTL